MTLCLIFDHSSSEGYMPHVAIEQSAYPTSAGSTLSGALTSLLQVDRTLGNAQP